MPNPSASASVPTPSTTGWSTYTPTRVDPIAELSGLPVCQVEVTDPNKSFKEYWATPVAVSAAP